MHNDKLKTVNTETVTELKKDLIKLSLESNDWRDGEPIMNFFDRYVYV